jgi:hypothetical protein
MISAHKLVALGFLAVFAVTGIYMRFHPSVHAADPTVQMLFRSSHIYLLLAALINGLLAIHLRPAPAGRERLQGSGSVLLALTPAIFVTSFFLESPLGSLNRPLIALGVLLLTIGASLHLAAHRGFRSTRGAL